MFTFCKARWTRQKKMKKNHATKVTKIPKTIRQKYGMNETIIWYVFREIKLLTGRLGSCTSAIPCFWYILDHREPFSIRNGLFPPFSYNICYPKAPQLFLAYLSCLFLPTWLNISSQNWRSITINYFEVDNSGLVCTQCPEKK